MELTWAASISVVRLNLRAFAAGDEGSSSRRMPIEARGRCVVDKYAILYHRYEDASDRESVIVGHSWRHPERFTNQDSIKEDSATKCAWNGRMLKV